MSRGKGDGRKEGGRATLCFVGCQGMLRLAPCTCLNAGSRQKRWTRCAYLGGHFCAIWASCARVRQRPGHLGYGMQACWGYAVRCLQHAPFPTVAERSYGGARLFCATPNLAHARVQCECVSGFGSVAPHPLASTATTDKPEAIAPLGTPCVRYPQLYRCRRLLKGRDRYTQQWHSAFLHCGYTLLS
jgi:hypothetical protein